MYTSLQYRRTWRPTRLFLVKHRHKQPDQVPFASLLLNNAQARGKELGTRHKTHWTFCAGLKEEKRKEDRNGGRGGGGYTTRGWLNSRTWWSDYARPNITIQLYRNDLGYLRFDRLGINKALFNRGGTELVDCPVKQNLFTVLGINKFYSH